MTAEEKIAYLRHKAERTAFLWYMRKGTIPPLLACILEATASPQAFLKYNPDQPRVPAGSGPISGQWTSGGGDDGADGIDDPGIVPVYPVENALLILFGGGLGRVGETLGDAADVAEGAGDETSAAAQAIRDRLENLLTPDGVPAGEAGGSPEVRELPGGAGVAEEWFQNLKEGGIEATPEGYEGTAYKMPDGSFIGYRPMSNSGEPTIDINVPSLRNIVEKLKFLGGDGQ